MLPFTGLFQWRCLSVKYMMFLFPPLLVYISCHRPVHSVLTYFKTAHKTSIYSQAFKEVAEFFCVRAIFFTKVILSFSLSKVFLLGRHGWMISDILFFSLSVVDHELVGFWFNKLFKTLLFQMWGSVFLSSKHNHLHFICRNASKQYHCHVSTWLFSPDKC